MSNEDFGAENDAPLIDSSRGSVERLIARAKRLGVISVSELNAALPQDEMSSEQIEDVMAAISEMGVKIVENEDDDDSSDSEADQEADDDRDGDGAFAESGEGTRRRTADSKSTESLGRSDDPVRLYLREMGAAEMLSREGEAAISKRIEAGRDMMILGLCESPITFHAIIQWSEALNNGEMQLREILDLDAMLSKEPAPESLSEDGEGDDDGEISEKTAGPSFKDEDEVEEESGDEVDEDGNPIPKREAEEEEEDNTLSLAQMEA
ncbi:RNA polymerase sigma factor region1.1 domain-containing protein, partial [Novosphingobium sp. YAF33]